MTFARIDQPTTATTAPRMDAAWLDAHWMPFTGNREFKANPRMIVEAEGAYYTDADGRKIFDGLSGLWCTGLGHGRREIVEAVGRQAATLDYAPAFQFGHPGSFELANKIKELTPDGLDYVFFTGSGSEAADTSLKMARAYWRAKGQGSKTRLIGREKGYHGVNFGGISVGGIGGQPQAVRPGRRGRSPAAHPAAHGLVPHAACRRPAPSSPTSCSTLIALHDASNIAAVIVEPFSGSAGVVIPPVGYLQRLREICTQNNILLIFDEVITGFGRAGAMHRRRGVRRHARHPEHRQAGHQRRAAARRGGRQEGDLRHLHGRRRPRVHGRVPARLHLLGPSGRLRRRRRRARSAAEGRHDRRASRSWRRTSRTPCTASRARSTWPTSATSASPPASRSHALPGEPAQRPYEIAMNVLEEGLLRPLRRRHHPARAAVHHREGRDRPPDQRAGRCAGRNRLNQTLLY